MIEINADAAHRDTLRAACRGHEEKLVAALASRQAAQDPQWKASIRADLERTRAFLRALDRGR